MNYIKSILFSVLPILLLNNAYWDFTNDLSQEQKECLEIIKDSNYDIKNTFTSTYSWYNTNDWLTWVDYIWENIFKKTQYNFWQKSEISQKDIFRYFDLIWVDLSDIYFYENELNFYEIENKNIFLSCSFVINKNLKWELKNLKKWDVYVIYTTTPEVIKLEEVVKNNKKYKKVYTKSYYKNKTWKDNILEVEKIYIIPENANLKNYYDLFALSDKYKEIVDWYKLRIENTDINNTNSFKEIYNKDDLSIKKYFAWDVDTSDPYWIKYIFINGINFMDDFAQYKRHHIFEFMLKDQSPLSKFITIVINKWDQENKTYWWDNQLSYIYWINYFLWINQEIPKDKIDVIPYFQHEQAFADNSFYKVADVFIDSKEDYNQYIYNTIYKEENINNPEKLLWVLNQIAVNGNFKELREKTEQFHEEYNLIKDSNNLEEKDKFVKKYINDYPKSFSLKGDSIKEVLNKNDTWSSNNNIKIILVFWLLFIFGTIFLIIKRKK